MNSGNNQMPNAQQIAPPEAPTWRQRCAYHEAGHVVVCLALDLPLAGAEISASGGRTWPENDALGQDAAIDVLQMAHVIGPPSSRLFGKFRDQIVLCLAGGMAEEFMFPTPRDKYFDQDQVEARLRAELVAYSGRGAPAFLEYCSQECKAVLGKHRPAIEAIAVTLLERGSLDGDQLRAVWLNSSRNLVVVDDKGEPRGSCVRHKQIDWG
jgi:hypothetical protein